MHEARLVECYWLAISLKDFTLNCKLAKSQIRPSAYKLVASLKLMHMVVISRFIQVVLIFSYNPRAKACTPHSEIQTSNTLCYWRLNIATL